MKRPLFWKLILSYSLLSLMILSLILSTSFLSQLSTINENTLNNIKINSYILIDYINVIQSETIYSDKTFYENIIHKSELLGFKKSSIIDERTMKKVFGTLEEETIEKEATYVISAITKLSFRGDFFTYKIINNNIYVYIPFPQNKNILVLKLQNDFSESTLKFNKLLELFLIIFVCATILHLLFAQYFYANVFKRLKQINSLKDPIVNKDYSVRLFDKKHKDEISSIFSMINTLVSESEQTISFAYEANPLTKLAGNHAIKSEILKRMEAKNKYAIIYSDLDNFKAYNDKYGFENGDRVILLLKNELLNVKKFFSDFYIFIGHVGGDDFVVLLDYSLYVPFCLKLISAFDYKVRSNEFYSNEDIENGYIKGVDRQGIPTTFKLVSVSLAVVSNNYRNPKDYEELIQWSADLKKQVKNDPKKKGSNYLEDTRSK